MNSKIYNATVAQLRAKAMTDLLELEASLAGQPSEKSVERACQCAQNLVQSEGALLTLQQYFNPPAPVAPPKPKVNTPADPPPAPPVKITPEMSATYRKSIAAEERRKKAEDAKLAQEKEVKAKGKRSTRRKKNE
jgi:hypothetical protein